MNEKDEEIRSRLMSDEPLNGDVEGLKQKLLGEYDAARKRVLVRLTLWVLAGLAITFGGAWTLNQATDTRVMLVAVVLILIGVETTILVKLWYWTVDSKVATLREIKKLQLWAMGGAAGGESESAVSAGRVSVWNRISKKTLCRVASVLMLVAGVAGGIVFFGPLFTPKPAVLYRFECHGKATWQGAVEMTARMVHDYYGVKPLERIAIRTGEPLEGVRWYDSRGTELEHSLERHGGDCFYSVQLAGPLYREERVDLRARWTDDDALGRENGRWVFVAPPAWRGAVRPQYGLTRYPHRLGWIERRTVSTLALPSGATVQSVAAEKSLRWKEGDRYVVLVEDADEVPEERGIRITFSRSSEQGT